MVLIAIAGMALFSWINASFDSINRIDAANARATAQLNALEFIKVVNPMQRPSGREKIGALLIEWDARELSPARFTLDEEGNPGLFKVALFEVVVTVESLPAVPEYRFVVRQMGSIRSGGGGGLFDDANDVKRPASK